jgi:hypothetical protein
MTDFCSPPSPSYPLILNQGDLSASTLYFNAGPVALVLNATAGVSPSVAVDKPECFSIGQYVRLATTNDCCQLLVGCYTVTGITNSVLTLTWVYGDVSERSTQGWLTTPMNLNGFFLSGSIYTKPTNLPNLPGVTGCVSVGEDSILIKVANDIAPGDKLTLAGSGITNAKVLGVYTDSQATSTVKRSSGSGCGCSTGGSSTRSSGGNTVVLVDQVASSTIACTAPAKITRSAGVLATFTATIPEGADAECGVLGLTVADVCLSDFPLPSDSCGEDAYLVGCYKMMLSLGAPADEDYPDSSPSWAKTIAQGPVYLK